MTKSISFLNEWSEYLIGVVHLGTGEMIWAPAGDGVSDEVLGRHQKSEDDEEGGSVAATDPVYVRISTSYPRVTDVPNEGE